MRSSTEPAHRMCPTLLIVFSFWDAALHPDEGPSAHKYRACAQNVSDVTHSFYIWGCWPAPRGGTGVLTTPMFDILHLGFGQIGGYASNLEPSRTQK